MDSTWPKKAADSFWLAAARNLEKRRLNTTQYQMLLIPGVVCLAFSIELGMKAMLLGTRRPPRTHNLCDLFAELPGDIRDEIISSCGKPREEFDNLLSAVADTFEEWRYVYELEEPAINLPFLSSLADAVRIATDAHAS